ncbi:MAG: hypothetical protein ACP5NF_10295 [Thermoanaerobaculum sp.]
MKGYREVKVTLSGKTVRCDPDPAVLYFNSGPDCLRFVFPGMPKEVDSVVIRWKDPSRPLFAGWGLAPSSVGSHLAEVITRGNNRVPGKYFYSVELLDAAGSVVAEADPGVENQGDPP